MALLHVPLSRASRLATRALHNRYTRPGVSDAFLPPWGKPAYDTRLLNLDGTHIFATYNCKACVRRHARTSALGQEMKRACGQAAPSLTARTFPPAAPRMFTDIQRDAAGDDRRDHL